MSDHPLHNHILGPHPPLPAVLLPWARTWLAVAYPRSRYHQDTASSSDGGQAHRVGGEGGFVELPARHQRPMSMQLM